MRLLIAEDDPEIRSEFVRLFESNAFLVDAVEDGETVLELGLENDYDAVILDPGLPQRSGESILSNWRRSDRRFPVLVVTGTRLTTFDVKDLIRLGATYHFTKPVDHELLLEWVRSVVNSRGPATAGATLTVGELTIDTTSEAVSYRGARLSLATPEYRILHYLASADGRIVSRQELCEKCFDDFSGGGVDQVNVYIMRLRNKIDHKFIQNHRGKGYCLRP